MPEPSGEPKSPLVSLLESTSNAATGLPQSFVDESAQKPHDVANSTFDSYPTCDSIWHVRIRCWPQMDLGRRHNQRIGCCGIRRRYFTLRCIPSDLFAIFSVAHAYATWLTTVHSISTARCRAWGLPCFVDQRALGRKSRLDAFAGIPTVLYSVYWCWCCSRRRISTCRSALL